MGPCTWRSQRVKDKILINEEIIKKYKILLGDKGRKEYYFNKVDKVLQINTVDANMLLKNQLKIKQKTGI